MVNCSTFPSYPSLILTTPATSALRSFAPFSRDTARSWTPTSWRSCWPWQTATLRGGSATRTSSTWWVLWLAGPLSPWLCLKHWLLRDSPFPSLPLSTPVFAVSLHHTLHGLAQVFSGDWTLKSRVKLLLIFPGKQVCMGRNWGSCCKRSMKQWLRLVLRLLLSISIGSCCKEPFVWKQRSVSLNVSYFI